VTNAPGNPSSWLEWRFDGQRGAAAVSSLPSRTPAQPGQPATGVGRVASQVALLTW
jgi:hypothetical protein